MNRRTLFVTIFIAVNLLNATARAEVPPDTRTTTSTATSPDGKSSATATVTHGPDGKAIVETSAGDRPTATSSIISESYTELPKALTSIRIGGKLKIKDLVDLTGKKEEKVLDFETGRVKFTAWLETFKKVRLEQATCQLATPSDANAKAMGAHLDAIVDELYAKITSDPTKAAGLEAKKLLTLISQFERYLIERAKAFDKEDKEEVQKDPKIEVLKRDVELRAQLIKTYEMFFGNYAEAKKNFDEEAALKEEVTIVVDGVSKPTKPLAKIVTDMTESVAALRKSVTILPVATLCKPVVASTEAVSAADKDKLEKEKAAAKKKADEALALKKKQEEEAKAKKIAAQKLNPAPPTGNPVASGTGGTGGTAGAGGTTATTATTGTTADTGSQAGNGNPGIQTPPQGQIQNFDQLQPFLDNIKNQGLQQQADLDRRARELELLGQKQLQDLARQAALDNANRNNNNDAVADALKNVGNRQGDRSNTENPQQPIQPPNISPDLSRGNSAPPPVPPSEPEQQQVPPPPQFFPPMGGYGQQGGPQVVSQQLPPPEERRRPPAVVIPQNTGILDMLRATQADLAKQQMERARLAQVAATGTGTNASRILNGPTTRRNGRTGLAALTARRTGNAALRKGPNAQLSINPNARTSLPSSVLSRSNLQ